MKLGLLAVVALGLTVAGCGTDSGSCEGLYGTGTYGGSECHDNWSKSECDKWNTDRVNSSSWTYHAGQSCQDRGYTQMCSDGSWVKPNGSWSPCS